MLASAAGYASLPRDRGAALGSVSDRVEAAEWDWFVATQDGGDLVQTAAWGRAKRASGLGAEIALALDGAKIQGGALLVTKSFGPLGAIGYVARGPLVADRSPRAIDQVLTRLEQVARARRVRHLIVQPPLGSDDLATALEQRGYVADAVEVAPSATLRLDLSRSPEQLLLDMSAMRRRNVRQAMRLGVVVRWGGRNDIAAFQAMHAATAQRQGFAALSPSYLSAHWDALPPSGSVRLALAEHEGRPLAGLWLTCFEQTVTFRLAGWTGEGSHLQSNVACHWHAIQWAKANGYRFYDFGGIDRPVAELMQADAVVPTSLVRTSTAFKLGFGGSASVLPRAHQRTLVPLARPILRRLLAADGHYLRRFINRLRNG